MSKLFLSSIAFIRFSVGASSILAPKLASQVFFVPFASAAPIVLRVFGSRDAALAGFLWLSRDKPELRRQALILGLVVDSIDVLATTACVLEGNLGWEGAGIFGGGALILAALGTAALRVSEKASGEVKL